MRPNAYPLVFLRRLIDCAAFAGIYSVQEVCSLIPHPLIRRTTMTRRRGPHRLPRAVRSHQQPNGVGLLDGVPPYVLAPCSSQAGMQDSCLPRVVLVLCCLLLLIFAVTMQHHAIYFCEWYPHIAGMC